MNEAPEKIYLTTNENGIHYYTEGIPFERECVEYVRKDTFIDKAYRDKELSLSLQIQAYLNTASDELYAPGKPLCSEKHIKDIHKCMLMWKKLHDSYFNRIYTWSEEDENRFSNLIYLVKRSGENEATKNGFINFINKLKSFKDRYTWKLSEEQIEALEHFVRSIGESGFCSPYDSNTKLIYSLLEQLKKLK